jgi:hypothetical protein
MNNTPALELEVMPSANAAVAELSATQEKALSLYSHFEKPFALAAELIALGKGVKTPAEAREIRLKLVKARTGIVATKDAAKAGIKLEGEIIQFYHNKAVAKIQEEETRLSDIEKAEEIRLAKERESRRVARLAELAAVGMDGAHFPLGEMLPDPYAQLLSGARLAHEAKIAAEAKAKEEARMAAEKAEADRVAREAAELAERERIKAENARLQAEKEAAEALARAEREKAAEAARIAAAEREKIEAAARAAAEVARKEKEAAEAKAAAELKAAQEKARKERELAEAKAKELQAIAAEAARVEREKRLELERAEAARVAAEKQKLADEQAVAARAAAAPDKEKLVELAKKIVACEPPAMSTPEGKAAAVRIERAINDLVDVIRAEYRALGKA